VDRDNRANLQVYRRWATIYDALLSHVFAAGRRRAFELLNLQPGERVLLVGVGTGLDLPLVPGGVATVGIDLSPDMLARAAGKLPLPGRSVVLMRGDAQALPYSDARFDAVVLNLILSVVPDVASCWREALRVTRPGGRLVVFDKFLAERQPSVARRWLNHVAMAAGTDLNRRFDDITAGSRFHLTRDEPSLLGGAYRLILAERPR
jgi:ubiquinone/menaquinone biosynthesis C-methylase UbiE